jgi:hypothetical protein
MQVIYLLKKYFVFLTVKTIEMTVTITNKTTKKQLNKILEKLPNKQTGVDFTKFFGKVKLPKKFNVVSEQRNTRNDGTYNY